MELLIVFVYYGGFFVVAALLAWIGYADRVRRPGFNRWHWAALVAALLGAASMYAFHLWAGAMRGAVTG